jgi:hypothetical protein
MPDVHPQAGGKMILQNEPSNLGDHLVTGTYLTAAGTTLSPAVPPAMVASRSR